MSKGKKKILFLTGTLDSGGVSKSLLNLLNLIDKQRYDVSLLLASTRGAFSNQVPNGVRLLTDRRLTALSAGVSGLSDLFLHLNLLLLLGSLLRLALSACRKRAWAGWLLSRLMPRVTEQTYDLAVDYNGQHLLYYMVDKVKSRKKISFFHCDYRQWNYYYSVDKRYYPRVDGIFSISDTCVTALKEMFPECAAKVHQMQNLVCPDVLYRQAEAPVQEAVGKGCLLLLSIGHLTKSKGTDMALKVARELKSCGYKFEWWFIGTDSKDCDYPQMIDDYGLNDCVRLLGLKANPYPYIKKADIVVHLSRYEGKSIALDEAKMFCKPVVVTNFSTVTDQFENRVNGTICEMTVESAVSAISELLEDESLRHQYISYLQTHVIDNSRELNKLYDLLSE